MPRERYQVWTDAEVAWLREARAQGATFQALASALVAREDFHAAGGVRESPLGVPTVSRLADSSVR